MKPKMTMSPKIEFEETKGEIDEEIKLDEDKRTVLTKYYKSRNNISL